MSECRFCRRAFPHFLTTDVWFSPVSQDKTRQRSDILSSSDFDKPCTYTSVLRCKSLKTDLWTSSMLMPTWENLFRCKSATRPGLVSCVCHLQYLQNTPISFFSSSCMRWHVWKGRREKIQICSFSYDLGKRLCLFNKSVVSTVIVYDLTDVLCFFHFTQISALKSLSTCSVNACQ